MPIWCSTTNLGRLIHNTLTRNRSVSVIAAALYSGFGLAVLLGAQVAVATPACVDLAATITLDLDALSATSTISPASGTIPAFCLVNVLLKPAVNVQIGLPLNTADGGSGGIQGAWNGRVQNLGGPGFVGVLPPVGAPIVSGYVGSSTDTGHSAGWCNAVNSQTGKPNSQPNCGLAGGAFVLDSDNNLLMDQVKAFIVYGVYVQTTSTLVVAQRYYGMPAVRNYWNGCSTGGREGLQLAQAAPHLFDGILAGAPAINRNRLINELWPAIVVKDVVGPGGLAPAKTAAANAAAVAACDANDGVADGLMSDPRRCHYDATALVCSGVPGDPATCLTGGEADAINRIWDGPRNQRGQRLWGGLLRGTTFDTLLAGGVAPNPLVQTYEQNWLHEDPTFDWRQIGLASFSAEVQASDRKFRVLAASDSPNLDAARERGTKIVHYHGLADQLVVPFGSFNYVTRVFDRYGVQGTQQFMRSFFYPGNGHCTGGNAPAINNSDLFAALVNWVENDVTPDYIVARQALPGGLTRSRKVCKYPDEAVYVGTGSTDSESSFACIVHYQEPPDLAAESRDIATQYEEAP